MNQPRVLVVDDDPALLQAPINVLRLSLHPRGLAPRIVNLAEWRAHLLDRLRRQIELTADPVLVELMRELRDYRAPDGRASLTTVAEPGYGGVLVPLRLTGGASTLSFFSTTTVFGTPVDITLAELALESFFPADTETANALREAVAR